MKLTLVRLAQDAVATLGHIETTEHEVLCVSLELPWKDNQHSVSCIPAGTYDGHRALHHGKLEVWRLSGVPERTAVDIHPGNTAADSLGCVLVGTSYGANHTITESKKAFDRLMARTARATTLTLEVRDGWCEEVA